MRTKKVKRRTGGIGVDSRRINALVNVSLLMLVSCASDLKKSDQGRRLQSSAEDGARADRLSQQKLDDDALNFSGKDYAPIKFYSLPLFDELREEIDDALRHQDGAKALAVANKLKRADPDNYFVLKVEGVAYGIARMYEEQIKVCKRILKENPSDASELLSLGTAYAGLKDWSNAVKVYRAGIRAEPTNELLWSHLGEALAHQGDYSGASQAVETSIRLKPDEWILYMTASGVYAMFGYEQLSRWTLERYHKRKQLQNGEPNSFGK